MGTGSLGALSTASMAARGAALASVYTQEIAPAPAPAPRSSASTKAARQKAQQEENVANMKKAVKVVRVASRILRIAGIPVPF